MHGSSIEFGLHTINCSFNTFDLMPYLEQNIIGSFYHHRHLINAPTGKYRYPEHTECENDVKNFLYLHRIVFFIISPHPKYVNYARAWASNSSARAISTFIMTRSISSDSSVFSSDRNVIESVLLFRPDAIPSPR